MQESLNASIVRIRTADGRVVGAGFLVGQRHILTCAHVISKALNLPDTPSDPPQESVSLDFPLIPPRTLLSAHVGVTILFREKPRLRPLKRLLMKHFVA